MDASIIFIVIAVIAIIAFFTIFFNKKAIIKRKLKKAELKPINQFRDNEEARIVGEVEFVGEPLIAPLSGRPCAYYYVHVEQEKSTGKSSSWSTLIEEEVSGEYVIRDGANYAYINGRHIKSYIVQDRNYRSGFLNDAADHLENYLNRKGYESENMLGFNKTMRYKEGVLEKGEKIAVYGKGVWRSATELNLPEKFGRVLSISEPNDDEIYLSDDPDTTHEEVKKAHKEKVESNYGGADSRYFEKSKDEHFYQK